jgi:hypothetical protein
MIISLKPDQQSQDEYIVCPRTPTTAAELRGRMLQRAKVIEGSYAYRLVDNLHSAILAQSLDLKADYVTYFSREYESFGEYLRRRLRFPSAVVTSLTEAVDMSSGMYHFRPAYSFLTDEYGLNLLKRLLEDPSAGEAL